jgi:hypothetical protein
VGSLVGSWSRLVGLGIDYARQSEERRGRVSDRPMQKWALIAEVAGAMAVVITLGFVALEMRGNTNAIKAQTYQDLMQQVNDYRVLLLDHPERSALQDRMRTEGWESLAREVVVDSQQFSPPSGETKKYTT